MKCGFFNSEKMATACVEYINRELVIPCPGKVIKSDSRDQYRLEFDGLDSYATTREKIHNTINDFMAGWLAGMEHAYELVEKIKTKKTK